MLGMAINLLKNDLNALRAALANIDAHRVEPCRVHGLTIADYPIGRTSGALDYAYDLVQGVANRLEASLTREAALAAQNDESVSTEPVVSDTTG